MCFSERAPINEERAQWFDATSQPAQSEPCWCTRVQFSAHLLQQVPEAAKNKACICQRCATTAATEPTALTSIVKD